MRNPIFVLFPFVCVCTLLSFGTSFSLLAVKPSSSSLWILHKQYHHHLFSYDEQRQSTNRRIPSMLQMVGEEEGETAATTKAKTEDFPNDQNEGTVAATAPREPTIDRPEMPAGSSAELLYALGVNLARQLGDVRPLVESGEELAQVAKGLLDTVIGRLTEEGQRDLLARRGAELNELITERALKIKERLSQAGREMLESMAATEGAVTLPSGVVVHILEHGPDGPGRGVRPTKASTVKIHYHGTLADGTVFDSTLGGEPVQFPLAGVIPGWRDGVLKMHEGETAMLGIPPEQGYGENGTPDGRIPGGSTLFFKVQLIEVLSAGIGGEPTLLGADGKAISKKGASSGGGLLGLDGKPIS